MYFRYVFLIRVHGGADNSFTPIFNRDFFFDKPVACLESARAEGIKRRRTKSAFVWAEITLVTRRLCVWTFIIFFF